MARPLTLSLIQQRYTDNVPENLAVTLQAIEAASAQGAQLVVLSELHRTRYFCQQEEVPLFDLAETIPGPTTDFFASAARRLKVVLVLSIFERRLPGLYHNTAVVLDTQGEIAGCYRKMHIPDDPGYYEKYYFSPGDTGFSPISTSVGKLGVMVCWDQWFPEGARLMALSGADILIYPTAIGWDPRDDANTHQNQQEAWMIAQRAHGISNGLFVAVCNRVGLEADSSLTGPGIDFWGASFLSGPQGELLALASSRHSEILTATIDLDETEKIRRLWPFLRDRRVDAYGGLVRCAL